MEAIKDSLSYLRQELKSSRDNLLTCAKNGENEESFAVRLLLSEKENLEQELKEKEKELKEKEKEKEKELKEKEKEKELKEKEKEKELKDEIKRKDENLMALFLAGKDGNDPAVKFLMEEKSRLEGQVTALWGRRLGTAALGEEVRADVGTSATNSAELAAAIASHLLRDLHGLATFGKEDSVSISSVNSTIWPKVARAQHLTLKPWEGCLVPSHCKLVERFGWDDRQEGAQAERYIPYLQNSVATPRSVCWVNGNSHKGMLSVETEDLPFKLKGTTDVAICTRAAVKLLNPTLGLRVLFELKKEVKKEGQFQALAALVCANILCPDLRPVLVYTDLNNVWHLYWIDASTLYGLSQERAVVIGLVEDLLREGDDVRMEDATVRADDGGSPFLNRRKILGAVRAVDREGDTANIGDLEGMLPQEEIIHGQQLLLLQELCNIPAVWQMCHPDSVPENHSIPGMSEEPHSSPPSMMYV